MGKDEVKFWGRKKIFWNWLEVAKYTSLLLHDLLLCMYELIFSSFYVEYLHTKVLTSHHVSQRINNLKEILFWIEEFDLFSLLFTWGLPCQRFQQRWLSSLPSCPRPPHPLISMKIIKFDDRWARLTTQLEMKVNFSRMNVSIKFSFASGRQNSPREGPRSSPSRRCSSRHCRPSSRCCWRCSPPSQRCSRQNLSS